MPILIFDSGVGGLSIMREIQRTQPDAHLVYLGDTARLPYGIKSEQTIQRYMKNAMKFFLNYQEQNPVALIIACNTASAYAKNVAEEFYPDLPVFDVIGPAAEEAIKITQNKSITVLATESTVKSDVYKSHITALNQDITVSQIACPLFVTLAEEGWIEGPEVEAVIKKSLKPYLDTPKDQRSDTIILGCTHFPLLEDAIKNVIGQNVHLITSAGPLARQLALTIRCDGGLTEPEPIEFNVTDSKDRFINIGSHFLGYEINPENVHLVDLPT